MMSIKIAEVQAEIKDDTEAHRNVSEIYEHLQKLQERLQQFASIKEKSEEQEREFQGLRSGISQLEQYIAMPILALKKIVVPKQLVDLTVPIPSSLKVKGS